MDLKKIKLFKELKKKYGYELAADRDIADQLTDLDLFESLLIMDANAKITEAVNFLADNWRKDEDGIFELDYVLTKQFSSYVKEIISKQKDEEETECLSTLSKETIHD